jgi:hypothetical protein
MIHKPGSSFTIGWMFAIGSCPDVLERSFTERPNYIPIKFFPVFLSPLLVLPDLFSMKEAEKSAQQAETYEQQGCWHVPPA